jgi:pyruvate dehydrogenase E1 component beta subunit
MAEERVISMYQAIAEAIGQEMERDERVFVLGEDVGVYGGIFGATTELRNQFGDERVLDTPISEMGFVGAAVGAALEGMRPIAEVMFIDFIGACFDQVLNHFSKIHYMSGGQLQVPMVIMTAIGGGYNDAAQHSQCLYSLFGHIPGIKVVVPSTPRDAKGLMTESIRDDNPVMYFFHKGLMGLPWMSIIDATWAPVPEEAYTIPFGVADVKREGTDVTLVTLSMMVHRSLEAAEKLAGEGISVEVIDLRTLKPLDMETITASVRKTGRVVGLTEAYRTGSFISELAMRIQEEAFDWLDAPVIRVAAADVPVPMSETLEDAAIPNVEAIVAGIHEVLR